MTALAQRPKTYDDPKHTTDKVKAVFFEGLPLEGQADPRLRLRRRAQGGGGKEGRPRWSGRRRRRFGVSGLGEVVARPRLRGHFDGHRRQRARQPVEQFHPPRVRRSAGLDRLRPSRSAAQRPGGLPCGCRCPWPIGSSVAAASRPADARGAGGRLVGRISDVHRRGVDQRFKFAVPVYGCGFLGVNSAWGRVAGDGAEQGQLLARTVGPLDLSAQRDNAHAVGVRNQRFRFPLDRCGVV